MTTTDHHLLDPWCCGEANHPIHLDKGPANDKSYKRQASSSKQRLTMVQGSCRMYIERYIMDNEQLKRIADVLEEILQLVKADQERSKKYMEENKSE